MPGRVTAPWTTAAAADTSSLRNTPQPADRARRQKSTSAVPGRDAVPALVRVAWAMREEENYERTYRRHIAGHCQPCLQKKSLQDDQWCGGRRFAGLPGPGKGYADAGSGRRRSPVSRSRGEVQRELLSAGICLLRPHSLRRVPPLLPRPLLRGLAILLRIKLLQLWFDLLWKQHLLPPEYGLLQRQMLLQSQGDMLRWRVLPGRLSVLRQQMRKDPAVRKLHLYTGVRSPTHFVISSTK